MIGDARYSASRAKATTVGRADAPASDSRPFAGRSRMRCERSEACETSRTRRGLANSRAPVRDALRAETPAGKARVKAIRSKPAGEGWAPDRAMASGDDAVAGKRAASLQSKAQMTAAPAANGPIK